MWFTLYLCQRNQAEQEFIYLFFTMVKFHFYNKDVCSAACEVLGMVKCKVALLMSLKPNISENWFWRHQRVNDEDAYFVFVEWIISKWKAATIFTMLISNYLKLGTTGHLLDVRLHNQSLKTHCKSKNLFCPVVRLVAQSEFKGIFSPVL